MYVNIDRHSLLYPWCMIVEQYDVKVKIISVDFADGPAIYDKIRIELSGFEIGILINNVGITYEFPNYFVDIPDDRLWQLINVNMASTVMVSYDIVICNLFITGPFR